MNIIFQLTFLLVFCYHAFCANLKLQTDVPAIVISSNLRVSEITHFPNDYDPSVPLKNPVFIDLLTDIVGRCSSDAYILVNQPGLKRSDFSQFQDHFVSLRNYIKQASTVFKFEKVDAFDSNQFDTLIENLKEVCNVNKIMNIRGNVTDDYQPYIDIDKRIITIDYPSLPENEQERVLAIQDYDKFLRYVIAQIPSPSHTIIYTSLNVTKVTDLELQMPVFMFDEIFEGKCHKGGVEKNNRVFEVPPTINRYQPKFPGMTSEYVTAFNSQFIEENKDLLKMIASILTGYILWQLFFYFKSKNDTIVTKNLVKEKSSKVEHSSKTEDTDKKHLNDTVDDTDLEEIERKKDSTTETENGTVKKRSKKSN